MKHLHAIILAGLLSLALATVTGAANAQDRYEAWHRDDKETRRNLPGDFDYYALVLSWSPTYCATSDNDNDGQQCDRRDGKRYAFVLHGLWPQYQNGYPQSCRTRRRPFVPQPVIDSMLDIMPSRGLVIHEYRKHGTCSGLTVENYFTLARQLFSRIAIPDRYQNPFETQIVSPDDLIREFVRANPNLDPGMIAVACGGAGNRLREVRICFSKQGKPIACGSNENQRRMCRAQEMYVLPVRSTAREGALEPTNKSAFNLASKTAP